MTLMLDLWLKCGIKLLINMGLSLINQSTLGNSHLEIFNILPYKVAKWSMEEKKVD